LNTKSLAENHLPKEAGISTNSKRTNF